MPSVVSRFPGVALITGAGGTGQSKSEHPNQSLCLTPISQGIGAAVAKAFAKSGCSKIAITDINRTSLGQTKDAILKINPRAEVFNHDGDISEESFVGSFTERVAEIFSHVDYAVNCAGILGQDLRSHETPTSAFDLINKVNYKGSWLTSRAALTQMLKQDPLPQHPGQRGAIVNIASQLGVVARPGGGKLSSLHVLDLNHG